MKINTAVFVLITTHYSASLEGQIIVRAVELMVFQGCISNECLLTPLFSLSFLCLDFHCLYQTHCFLYIPPPLPLSVFLPYPSHILCCAENNTAHN